MVFRNVHAKLWASSLIIAILLNPAFLAMAGSDFGNNWQPKPLVDHHLSKPSTSNTLKVTHNSQAFPTQADLEARLKPVEPFIHRLETKLFINPKPDALLVQRLNTLQTVLFGETRYQDAGALLAALAEIFPAEATQAQADLAQQLKNNIAGYPKSTTVQNPASTAIQSSDSRNLQSDPSAFQHSQPALQATSPPKKKRFWEDDWEDDFKNDPFFQDEPAGSQGGSRLGGIGQGLASLALIAGGIIGSRLLSQKLGEGGGLLGSNGFVPYNQIYSNPYVYGGQAYGGQYYQPYGSPYGYIPRQPYYYAPAYPYAYGGLPPQNPLGGLLNPQSVWGIPSGQVTSRLYTRYMD